MQMPMDCIFLIAPSVFSDIYLIVITFIYIPICVYLFVYRYFL